MIMATPEELYVDGIKKRFRNYFAAWLPDEKLKLGDVGILNGNIFIRTSNILDSSLGFQFIEREDLDPSPIDVVSESGVSMVVKAAGEVSRFMPNIPAADAGVAIEFASQGAFILKSPAVYQPSIENIEKLKADVLDAYLHSRWDKNWAVVVRLVKAPKATVIVSKSSRSKIEFTAQGDFTTGPIDLGNLNLSFAMRAQSGDLFQMIGATNLTPLFQLARLKKPFLRDPKVEILRKGQKKSSPIDLVTPENALTNPALDFNLITDADPEYLPGSRLYIED